MFKNKLTLDWIETTLKIDGFNAKEKVCNRLHYANEKELRELRNSVNERINKLCGGMNNDKEI